MSGQSFNYCLRLTRIKEWWEKFLHIGGSAYLLWAYTEQSSITVSSFSIYNAAIFCLLLGGYAINDFADFHQDMAVGRKVKPTRGHSLFLSVASLAIGFGLILSIASELLPGMITVVIIFLGVEYSLPPLRFKERKVWGVIIGSITQKPAIFLIFVAIIKSWGWLSLILSLWLFFGGLVGMLGHQILDYRNDNKLGVGTFAVFYGQDLSMKLAIVCAVLTGVTALMPVIFFPFLKALPVVLVLSAFSIVYPVKGLRSARKIRSSGIV